MQVINKRNAYEVGSMDASGMLPEHYKDLLLYTISMPFMRAALVRMIGFPPFPQQKDPSQLSETERKTNAIRTRLSQLTEEQLTKVVQHIDATPLAGSPLEKKIELIEATMAKILLPVPST